MRRECSYNNPVRFRVSAQLASGIRIATTPGMKRYVVLLAFLMTTSCARKVEVRAPEFIHRERYSYIKDGDGRVFIVTANTKDFDEAMQAIQPGPASVDKLDLWVITPLGPVKREPH